MQNYVMISGATGGLGRAFVVECAARGYDLYLTDLGADALRLLAESVTRTYGVDVQWFACDLSDSAQRDGLFDAIRMEQRRFWALINVAGIDHEGLFRDQKREHLRAILRLNIEAGVEMIRSLLDLRDPATTFRIINVASLAAFYPMPYKATYAASKRFLLDLSLALGEELAPEGVTVTALCPAGMPTTPECIEGIEAQGWAGHITTQNTGTVVAGALDAALRGKPVYVPGMVNRIVRAAGSLIPPALIVKLVGSRWKAARELRSEIGERPSARLATAP